MNPPGAKGAGEPGATASTEIPTLKPGDVIKVGFPSVPRTWARALVTKNRNAKVPSKPWRIDRMLYSPSALRTLPIVLKIRDVTIISVRRTLRGERKLRTEYIDLGLVRFSSLRIFTGMKIAWEVG